MHSKCIRLGANKRHFFMLHLFALYVCMFDWYCVCSNNVVKNSEVEVEIHLKSWVKERASRAEKKHAILATSTRVRSTLHPMEPRMAIIRRVLNITTQPQRMRIRYKAEFQQLTPMLTRWLKQTPWLMNVEEQLWGDSSVFVLKSTELGHSSLNFFLWRAQLK